MSRYESRVTEASKRILRIKNELYPDIWPDILKACRLRPISDEDAKELWKEQEKTLGDADDDEIEALSKLSIAAMKAGMNPNAPNAQMVRAYHAWLETREGEKQLREVVVNIVPGTVPDNMSQQLSDQMKELTEIASRS